MGVQAVAQSHGALKGGRDKPAALDLNDALEEEWRKTSDSASLHVRHVVCLALPPRLLLVRDDLGSAPAVRLLAGLQVHAELEPERREADLGDQLPLTGRVCPVWAPGDRARPLQNHDG